MSTDLVLGVDGGGSKTVAAVADRHGSVILLRRGAGLDPVACAAWPNRLARLLEGAAGVGRATLALPFHGEVEAISQAQRQTAAALLAMPHEVINDVQAAFEGALTERAGVLVLAGTGSMAWAGDGAGFACRVGDWGDLFGDEGSAFWVGREALSLTAQALDGRTRHRKFAQAILHSLSVTETDLIGWSYSLADRRAGIAAIAATIDGLARDGDATARSLLIQAADHLIDHVRAAWSRIGAPQPLVWTYAGGLFGSRTMLGRMAERLGEPARSRLPPVGGALLRAARAAGLPVNETWIAALAASLAAALAAETPDHNTKQGEAA